MTKEIQIYDLEQAINELLLESSLTITVSTGTYLAVSVGPYAYNHAEAIFLLDKAFQMGWKVILGTEQADTPSEAICKAWLAYKEGERTK